MSEFEADNTEFDEAFNTETVDVTPEPEVAADVPDTQVEQVEDQPEEERQTSDPLEGLNETQAEAVARLKAEREAWEHKYKSDQGRFLAAQRMLHDKKQEVKQNLPTREQVAEALKNTDKFKSFQEDYPDIAEIVLMQNDSLRNEIRNEVINELKPTVETLQQKAQQRELESQQAAIEREFAKLGAAHPDWDTVATSQEFQQWAVRQPGPVQQTIARSTNAEEISAIMSYYKSERRLAALETNSANAQQKNNMRDKALERSRGITPKGSAPPMEGNLPKNDFDAVFAAITK
jgi:hypothetical protein